MSRVTDWARGFAPSLKAMDDDELEAVLMQVMIAQAQRVLAKAAERRLMSGVDPDHARAIRAAGESLGRVISRMVDRGLYVDDESYRIALDAEFGRSKWG